MNLPNHRVQKSYITYPTRWCRLDHKHTLTHIHNIYMKLSCNVYHIPHTNLYHIPHMQLPQLLIMKGTHKGIYVYNNTGFFILYNILTPWKTKNQQTKVCTLVSVWNSSNWLLLKQNTLFVFHSFTHSFTHPFFLSFRYHSLLYKCAK